VIIYAKLFKEITIIEIMSRFDKGKRLDNGWNSGEYLDPKVEAFNELLDKY